MPGYKTHIAASSICGTVVGGVSFFFGHIDPVTSIYGGALCAIGGIVPDIDSENSTSFRKCLAIIAGFSSLLLVSRLRDYLLDPQAVAIIGGGNFIFAWFFLGGIIRKATVHRGMCHSIPMAILTGEITFLLSSGSMNERLYCGGSMVIGVLVHLVLDEFFSIQVKRGSIKLKKSLGSALKIVNFDDKKGSLIMLGILAVFTVLCVNEPVWTEDLPEKGTPEYIAQHENEELRIIQKKNPDLYDLSVIQWALDNNLQIRPKNQNNRKWKSIRDTLSTLDSKRFQAVSRNESGNATSQSTLTSSVILEFLSSDNDAEIAPTSGISGNPNSLTLP